MKKRGTYVITSLGGRPMSEGEIREALSEVASNKTFQAVVQVLEMELHEMREAASDPESLKDGTQPHYCGAVDGLNGGLLRLAEIAAGSHSDAPPRMKARRDAPSRAD